jgi:hypothetical protein
MIHVSMKRGMNLGVNNVMRDSSARPLQMRSIKMVRGNNAGMTPTKLAFQHN